MQPLTSRGTFLTIEGIEGVGKSTAVRYIQNYLTKMQQPYVVTREPGGTPIAEQIRTVLLTPHPTELMAPETELLLMFACRAQNIARLVAPALAEGKWVICDRFVDASYAYQGYGRQLSLQHIETLEKWVVGSCRPQMTILLDAAPKLGLARAKNRGAQDRIEQEELAFFERVRAGYLARAKQDPDRFCVIDASQPLVDVHSNIKSLLDKIISETQSENKFS